MDLIMSRMFVGPFFLFRRIGVTLECCRWGGLCKSRNAKQGGVPRDTLASGSH